MSQVRTVLSTSQDLFALMSKELEGVGGLTIKFCSENNEILANHYYRLPL